MANRSLFLGWMLLALSASCSVSRAEVSSAKLQHPHETNLVLLAFYHPWYGTPAGSAGQYYKWDSFRFPGRYDPNRILPNGRRDIASPDYPLIGLYDQGNREIVRWHFRLAKAAGIEGFLCSWWKFREDPSQWATWQAGLFEQVLLPVAKEEGFKLAIIDECAHYVRSFDQLLWRATNTLPRVTRHPAYLRIRDQPVWFVYQVWDDWLTATQAKSYVSETERVAGDLFWMFDKLKTVGTQEFPGARMFVQAEWLNIPQIDCYGTYSYFGHWRDTRAENIKALYEGFTRNVRETRKCAQLPLLAGHDNTSVEPKPYKVPRNRGETLRKFIAAIDEAQPEVAVICSFNEWLEGTEVEPAANWPDPYLYLRIIAKWRGKDWETPPLPRRAAH